MHVFVELDPAMLRPVSVRQVRITATVVVNDFALVLLPVQQQCPVYSNDPCHSPPDSEDQAAVLQVDATCADKQHNATYGWWGKLACLHVLLGVVVYLQWPNPVLAVIKAMRRWLHQKFQDQAGLQH